MNANEVRTLSENIVRESLASGISEFATFNKIRIYFTLDTDREQEWAMDFAKAYLLRNGSAALIREVVTLAGSQGLAAEHLGVDPASISRYLSGSEPIRPVVKLAKMLLKHRGILSTDAPDSTK